jgi:hypothetical protein
MSDRLILLEGFANGTPSLGTKIIGSETGEGNKKSFKGSGALT